jgi:hypothetical protein
VASDRKCKLKISHAQFLGKLRQVSARCTVAYAVYVTNRRTDPTLRFLLSMPRRREIVMGSPFLQIFFG